MTEILALAPYFGGKRNLAATIVQEIGEHRVYWELGCGSMAVLLAKPTASMETVVDLHGDLINLAKVVQHPLEGAKLYRMLRRTLLFEAGFRESAEAAFGEVTAAPDVDRAYHYFVSSWLGRNGVAGTNIGTKRGAGHSFAVRYTANGGQPGKRWTSVVDSIPAWRKRLREVMILRRDLFEVLGKIDDATGTAIYIDPPYLPETRTGLQAGGGQSRYVHDFTEADHLRLAKAVQRFGRARVVISYYDAPRLATLYPGWKIRRLEVSKAITNMGKRGQTEAVTKATEVLLSNVPLLEGAKPIRREAASLFD